jgi:hypothetical protein
VSDTPMRADCLAVIEVISDNDAPAPRVFVDD